MISIPLIIQAGLLLSYGSCIIFCLYDGPTQASAFSVVSQRSRCTPATSTTTTTKSSSSPIPKTTSRRTYYHANSLISSSYSSSRSVFGPLYSTEASSSSSSSSSSTTTTTTEQLTLIQDLFNKYSDEDGFLSKSTLETMPPFSEMLADGDLLPQELNDVWDVATADTTTDDKLRINFDSFVQVYQDIDDMFEDDDDDVDDVTGDNDGVPQSTTNALEETKVAEEDDDEEEDKSMGIDSELVQAFESLSNDDGLISKDSLKSWDEVSNLLSEGLLGEDEFEMIWNKTPKSAGSNDAYINSDGFLAFNLALDDLFDFDDDEDSEDISESDSNDDDITAKSSSTTRPMVAEGDLPPGVLFSNLANEDNVVGMDELSLWVELQDMLNEGELLKSELKEMFDKLAPSGGKLDEDAFLRLYDEIDNLFEDDGEDDDSELDSAVETVVPRSESDEAEKVKRDLLAFLEIVQEGDDDVLPCGLDASEPDQKQVLNIVKALEFQPSNLIKQKQGNIEMSDLAGTWDLLYSSSSAMKFNKGLSGLGGSFPNGKFASLKQKFTITKVLQDMEYTERIEVNPSTASFDVSVPGSWQLRKSVSLFTGEPSIVVQLEPERVNYGITSMRADHWKSLGPMNMLDLTYVDDDLRVMRGCTSSDTLFIWKRSSEGR